jgi:hypothetical protein
MSPKQVSAGKKFISDFASQAIKPAIIDAGKQVLTSFLKKKGIDLAGLGEAPAPIDPLADLRVEAEKSKLLRNISENKRQVRSDDNWHRDRDAEDLRRAEKEAEARAKQEERAKAQEPQSGSSKKKASKSKKKASKSKAAPTPKKVFEVSNRGARSVASLSKSGYMMKSLSELEGGPTAGISSERDKDRLGRFGGWTMRSLEDMERFI